ncbi:MAG: alanine racemase [Alicyclobacillus sp.]|nr:alanine racemase [Alicyclobacillus sp.]
MELYRGTFAIVDLNAIAANIRRIAARLTAGTRLLVAVKANGYGHGAVEVAKTVLSAGATDLGVASLEEGLQLRAAGVDAPILVFGAVPPEAAPVAAANRIAIALTEDWSIRDVPACPIPLHVHIKVDTGMTRLGFRDPDDIIKSARWLDTRPDLQFAGVFTHLACADDMSSDSAYQQLQRLNEAVDALRTAGFPPPLVHAANSAGTLRDPAFHLDMVRVGISTYGYKPDVAFPSPVKLEPAMHLYAFITRVAKVPAGTRVGYGGTFETTRTTVVATVPVGYADGYPRWLSNQGEVVVRGQRAKVIGRVCMDQLMIDVTDVPGVEPGDCVTLYGREAPKRWTAAALSQVPTADQPDWLSRTFMQEASPAVAISLDELADLGHTISYELMCALAARVPRIYVDLVSNSF